MPGFTVEADWSQAAFFAVLGALTGSVCCTGLATNSLQGDRVIADFLSQMGAAAAMAVLILVMIWKKVPGLITGGLDAGIAEIKKQLPDLERWCEAHDGEVVWFKDTFTGKTMNRPGMEKLLDALRTGKVERIVVWRLTA